MSESLSFLLLTVSAQQREELACGRIPPRPPPPACLGLNEIMRWSVHCAILDKYTVLIL